MKTRLAAIALIVVGLGAVVVSIVGPNLGGSSASTYLTSTATVGAVSATSVATGTIGASTVYGLKFGAAPDIVSSASTTASSASTGSSGSSASSGSGSSSSITWPVKTVAVTVGQTVKKGDVLATADDASAQIQLTLAQANLASAQAKLAEDQGGPDSLTLAQAKNQLSQSQASYSQAVANKKLTNQQSALQLSDAQAAVTAAQSKLDADIAAGAPQSVIDQDNAALAQAQSNLASVQLKVSQSNQQAAQQVTSASLNLAAARLQYQSKTAPADTATVLTDKAAVATAEQSLAAAELAVKNATIVAPADGLITAVNIVAGTNAASSYPIQLACRPMVATASFAEADIVNIKVGQAASVSVTAANATVDGTVSQIVPVASTSGGASSVVGYTVNVTLKSAPDAVLAGMSATVTVTTASVDDVLRVPATALNGSASAGYTVVVVGSDGRVQARSVQVGLVTTSFAQIDNGLSEGELVVVGTTSTRTGTSSNSGVNLGGLTGGGLQGGGFRP